VLNDDRKLVRVALMRDWRNMIVYVFGGCEWGGEVLVFVVDDDDDDGGWMLLSLVALYFYNGDQVIILKMI